MNTLVQVVPFLWVGSVPDFGPGIGKSHDRLVLTAREHQYSSHFFPGAFILHAPLRDTTPSQYEETLAIQAGRAVGAWMRREKNVLVTCGQGLNRSCLVAAIGMMTTGYSWTGAVETIRAARGPEALRNPYFQRLLRRLEDATSFQLASGI